MNLARSLDSKPVMIELKFISMFHWNAGIAVLRNFADTCQPVNLVSNTDWLVEVSKSDKSSWIVIICRLVLSLDSRGLLWQLIKASAHAGLAKGVCAVTAEKSCLKARNPLDFGTNRINRIW